MTRLVFRHEAPELPEPRGGVVPILMYGATPPSRGTACVGGPVLGSVRRLSVAADERAFDFLTVAMAVTAADTVVDRALAADGWCRDLHLDISLADPDAWLPVRPRLEKALAFLSGDTWSFEFSSGGPERPTPNRRGRRTNLSGHDCASLFSGGLDSTIGVLDLLRQERRPVLVSHSYGGDAKRQALVRRHLPAAVSRFAAIAYPRSDLDEDNDVQMRTRSFNFLAYGALIAATMGRSGAAASPVQLHVPENGFIALNPPLTRRRIGSLSTRTTHPHFLKLVQEILTALEMPVAICTAPYDLMTKGEMMRACRDGETLAAIAGSTVSCGHWKRIGMQCGRCIPCLIRRAAFHAAGIDDRTAYAETGSHLPSVLAHVGHRDDLLAMMLAIKAAQGRDMKRWISQSGPLPEEPDRRTELSAMASRAMTEVGDFLRSSGLRW